MPPSSKPNRTWVPRLNRVELAVRLENCVEVMKAAHAVLTGDFTGHKDSAQACKTVVKRLAKVLTENDNRTTAARERIADMEMGDEAFMSTAAVAALMGITPGSLLLRVRKGQAHPPVITGVGRGYAFTRGAVLQWIKSQEIPGKIGRPRKNWRGTNKFKKKDA